MPTLNDILSQIDMLYPNNFTNAQKVGIMNFLQREIFRELQLEGKSNFTTQEDQSFYDLENDCEVEFIEHIGIATSDSTNPTFQKYDYEPNLNADLSGYKWFRIPGNNDKFGIYPEPSISGRKGVIYYKRRPATLDYTTLTQVLDLEQDWHRILVYSVIIEIAGAGSNPDIDTVNNYTLKYNALMKEILQSKYNREPTYPLTKNAMPFSRNSRGGYDKDEVVINVS